MGFLVQIYLISYNIHRSVACLGGLDCLFIYITMTGRFWRRALQKMRGMYYIYVYIYIYIYIMYLKHKCELKRIFSCTILFLLGLHARRTPHKETRLHKEG